MVGFIIPTLTDEETEFRKFKQPAQGHMVVGAGIEIQVEYLMCD